MARLDDRDDGSGGAFRALSDDLAVQAPSTALATDLMNAEELLLLVLNDELVTALPPSAPIELEDVTHNDDAPAAAAATAAAAPQTCEPAPLRDSSSDATSSATQSEEDSAAPAASATPQQQQLQKAVVKVNPRRNRKRRKHEVDALRIEMRELTAKLAALRQSTADAKRALARADASDSELVAMHVEYPVDLARSDCSRLDGAQTTPGQWIVIKNEARVPRGRWETQAQTERDAAVAAMRENVHLRALYESKLETLRHLEALYSVQTQQQEAMLAMGSWTGDPLSPPWLQDVAASSAQLSKRARVNPFDPDFAIFASLGRDFDAQYAKVDAILAAAGVAHVESNYKREMRPTRGANGIYFLESVHARVHARDLFEHDEQHWRVMSHHDLNVRHGLFEIRELTDTTMFRKMVHTIRLANTTDVTLIRRTALKRYIEADRVVLVWDTVLEVTGPLAMQLRERGWKLMRPVVNRPLGMSATEPMHVDQTVTRITPELSSTYSPEDIGAGSVTNAVVQSYRRHMRWLHHLNREIFCAEFGKKLTLGCGASRCHRDASPACAASSNSAVDVGASDELPSLFAQSDGSSSRSSSSGGSLAGGPCKESSSWRPACVL